MLFITTVVLLMGFVSSQMVPMCATTTSDQCTVTFTAEGSSQTGPTSTVWGAIMTTYLNCIDCRYCQVENVPFNPYQKGPFTTKVTSPVMTVTAVGCMAETTAITRRGFRGYDEYSAAEAATTPQLGLSHPKSHLKRQTSVSPISGSGLPLEAQQYLTQLNTAIFIIDLINTRSNLSDDCQVLRNGNASMSAAVAINSTQAADFVCAAYATNLTSISPALLQVFAEALYAVELAGNFTGTTNTTTLCESVDVDILTLPIFGVDGQGVQSYVCNAFNATLNPSSTVTSSFATSAGTITPIASGNITSFGTAPIVTGPIASGNITSFGTAPIITGPIGTAPIVTGPLGTGAIVGTGGSGGPFGNMTGTRTRSFTGPRTRSGSGNLPPTATGSGSGYIPTGTDVSGGSNGGPPGGPTGSGSGYGNLTAFPTGYGSGEGQPSGTGFSGLPSGNLTGFPTDASGYTGPSGTGFSGPPFGGPTGFLTRSGQGYTLPTVPGGSDDPSSVPVSSSDPPPTARLPPDPSTLHFYPAISPSVSPAVFYGYGYGYRD